MIPFSLRRTLLPLCSTLIWLGAVSFVVYKASKATGDIHSRTPCVYDTALHRRLFGGTFSIREGVHYMALSRSQKTLGRILKQLRLT